MSALFPREDLQKIPIMLLPGCIVMSHAMARGAGIFLGKVEEDLGARKTTTDRVDFCLYPPLYLGFVSQKFLIALRKHGARFVPKISTVSTKSFGRYYLFSY